MATNGGGTQYNESYVIASSQTLYIYGSNNDCSDEVSFDITINRFNLIVFPNGTADCPDLSQTTTPAFNLENSSYNHGTTELTFRVTRDLTLNDNWFFDFTISGVLYLYGVLTLRF